ncbi:hypothetical protein C5167_004850 [Papaver somniferum]|uniref:Alpha/beta hydrolase fold-3 domain-containing protein n=1 Tax=Papaver somniferum TaxID=3469 RepID=A0A4Y7JC16_PAPSO|nr:carboxylesterase 1-like [Papaver somniferum]RZC57550.1 hypothetical protein C5167_004850 [Papaver somniferum]
MENHDHLSNPTLNSSSSNTSSYDLLKIVYDPQNVNLDYFRDIPLNTQNKTWIRLFRPDISLDMNKLPLIVYFHSGGFSCPVTSVHHDFCKSMAIHLPVNHRLSPENRLSATYEDAEDALFWVQNQALDAVNGDPWLRGYVDFSECFIMGCSSGGNIAYHVGLRSLELNLEPIQISGLILNQPYFGGLERTGSELRLINDKVLSLAKTDVMWELALPHGANRDHWYCNSIAKDATSRKKLDDERLIKWRCLVTGFTQDLLIDRQIEFVKMLENESPMKVVSLMKDGGYRLVAHFDSEIAEELFNVMREIIFSSSK